MSNTSSKVMKRERRHGRIRSRVIGTATRPRLAVYRSNRAIYAQLINDETGTTLVSADSRSVQGANTRERAKEVGALIAKTAKEKGITHVVFDRGGFKYLGSIVLLAEGAREGGLSF